MDFITLIKDLFILGFILFIAGTVFSLVSCFFMVAVSGVAAGIGWTAKKIAGMFSRKPNN